MTKIKNTRVYIKETEPTLSDFLVGTKDSNGKTKSFSLEAILQLLNSSNGVNNIQFKFSNGLHPTIDFLSAGYFFTDTNTTEVGTFTQLIFNKETIQPLDLSPLFNKLGELENVVIKLENPEDPNNFFNFKVVSFTDNTDYFTFGIEDFNELYLGEFENEKIYSFYFDILSESNFYITGTNDDAGGIKTGSITKRGELVIDSEEGNISGLVLNQVPNLVVTAYTIITPNTGENEPYIRPIGCMGNDDFYYVPMYPGIRKVNTTTGVIEDFSTFIGEPTAVCLGLDGFFYVLVSNSIIRIHPTTGAVMSTIYSGVNLSNAQCLVHATDNNIYIGFSVSPEGLGRLTLAGDLTIFSTIDGHCLYIDQGSDGLLYCNTGSRIYKATLDGIQTDFITLPTILALYCATDGFIYTHRYGLGILYKITYSGTIEELPVGLGEVIRAIDQSQNGTFYFNSENVVGKLNLPSNKVLKTDENGNVVKTTYLEDVQYLVPTDILGKEDKINKGVANGYAGLDSDGFVPLSQTNPSVLGRLVVVADQTARFALTTAIVQNGDTVKQLDVEIMYYVKDDTNLSNSNGYELYRAGTAASVPWTGVTGTPTSISGYGIIPASGDYTTALVTETTDKNYQTDIQKLYNDATSSIQTQLNNRELLGINSIAKVYVETNGNDSTGILGNKRKPFLTIDAALDALPAGGGVIKIGVGTFNSPTTAKVKSNTAFIGSKEPIVNSTVTFATPTSRPTITAPTELIDGTILNGQFRIEDRNNIRIENLGVDVGKTWVDTYNSGTAVNAMAILSTVSTTPCKNITVNNSTALGYSPSALFHAFVFQNVTDCHFSNLTSYYNTHGLVIKGTNITVDGLNAHSHTADGINIKSDIYAPCADVSLSNINITSLSGYESGGISLEEGVLGSSPLDRITISNVNLKYVSYGVRNVNTVKNVSISSLNAYDLNSFGFKLDTNVDNVNLSNINIVKTLTEGIDVSINGTETVNITNANVSDATGTGFKLTTAGTSIINIVNSNTLTTTASYLITGTGVYGNSNFGTGTKTGNINFKSQSIIDSASGISFFTGLATQTVNMLTLPTGTISLANANTSTSPTIYSKSLNTRGLLVMAGTPDINASADMEFGIRENDNTDFATLTSTAFRFTRFGTTLIDVLRNGNTAFTGNITANAATTASHVVIKSQLDLKANLISPVLTGTPTAPTASAGTNTTQIATTAFVTGAIVTADAGNIKTSGNQSFSGVKSSVNIGTTQINGFDLTNNGTTTGSWSFRITNSSSGIAHYINNNGTSTGYASYILNQGSGVGNYILSNSNGIANVTDVQSTSIGHVYNNTGTGLTIDGRNTGVTTFSVNKTGDVVANTVTLGSVLKLKAYTVGTLPAGTVGDMAYVTDALAPTYNNTVIGGGAVKIPVFHDGVSWKAH